MRNSGNRRDLVVAKLASVIAGGPAPLIATWLLAQYHSGDAIALYIAACAVVGVVSAAMMPDYTGRYISHEYDEPAGDRLAA